MDEFYQAKCTQHSPKPWMGGKRNDKNEASFDAEEHNKTCSYVAVVEQVEPDFYQAFCSRDHRILPPPYAPPPAHMWFGQKFSDKSSAENEANKHNQDWRPIMECRAEVKGLIN